MVKLFRTLKLEHTINHNIKQQRLSHSLTIQVKQTTFQMITIQVLSAQDANLNLFLKAIPKFLQGFNVQN